MTLSVRRSVSNGGTVVADKSIKLNPTTSVVGHRVGDEIKLSEAGFRKLSAAFFPELERMFA